MLEEPGRLLVDDLRDTTQAASILSLVGQGCHRVSKIARLPLAADREVVPVLWLRGAPSDVDRARVVTPEQVLACLR